MPFRDSGNWFLESRTSIKADAFILRNFKTSIMAFDILKTSLQTPNYYVPNQGGRNSHTNA